MAQAREEVEGFGPPRHGAIASFSRVLISAHFCRYQPGIWKSNLGASGRKPSSMLVGSREMGLSAAAPASAVAASPKGLKPAGRASCCTLTRSHRGHASSLSGTAPAALPSLLTVPAEHTHTHTHPAPSLSTKRKMGRLSFHLQADKRAELTALEVQNGAWHVWVGRNVQLLCPTPTRDLPEQDMHHELAAGLC
jgi:hypothetical protein